jgi:hypothetical protein
MSRTAEFRALSSLLMLLSMSGKNGPENTWELSSHTTNAVARCAVAQTSAMPGYARNRGAR